MKQLIMNRYFHFLKFLKMPIIDRGFSNRYEEPEDFEEYCGAESYPYVILREPDQEEPVVKAEDASSNQIPPTFWERVLIALKLNKNSKLRYRIGF